MKKVNRQTQPHGGSFEILGKCFDVPFTSDSKPTRNRILITASKLFATHGYDAVSIRDMADLVGITPGALYNHFASKEDLLDEILNQARTSYMLYFKHLDEALAQAKSYNETLDTIFDEPLKMKNDYTTFLFAFVISDQLRSPKISELYRETFLRHGVSVVEKWLAENAARGWIKSFDTLTVARILINGVFGAIMLKLHEQLSGSGSADYREMLLSLKAFLSSLQ